MIPTKIRRALLATASVVALTLIVGDSVLADDIEQPVGSDRFWLSLTGQYLMYDGDSFDYTTNSDLPLSLIPKGGWQGGVELGYQPAQSQYSILGRLQYGQSKTVRGSASFHNSSYSYGDAEAEHKENHTIVDLEIGRDVGLGALGEARVFAGVRFASFKGKGSFSSSHYSYYSYYSYSSGSTSGSAKSTFTGVGPRIGFDAMLPASDQVSLDVGAGGAVLFAKQKAKASGTYYSYSRSKSVIVPNFDASIAFSYFFTPNAKLSLGYQADAYFNVFDVGGNGGHENGDRIIHGPFATFTIGGVGP